MVIRAGLIGRGTCAALALVLCVALESPAQAIECVPYARQISGVQIKGDAWTWWGQARPAGYETGGRPQAGAVMVFRRAHAMRRGHVAVVREIVGPREIIIDHANWQSRRSARKGRIDRGISVIDVSARNDWSSVRVWYPPIDDYGSSVYPLYGFIYGDRDDRAIEVAAVAAGGRLHLRRDEGRRDERAEASADTRAADRAAPVPAPASGTLHAVARAGEAVPGTLDAQLATAQHTAATLQIRAGKPVMMGRPVYSDGDPKPAAAAEMPHRRQTEQADVAARPASTAVGSVPAVPRPSVKPSSAVAAAPAPAPAISVDRSPVRYVAMKPGIESPVVAAAEAEAGVVEVASAADAALPAVLPTLKPAP
ncbi:CHAP domain-containing protein [Zavarzinia compransoris]|uniref:CHAP domain-containing protein n=1 Tax=Zavarzinia marina TaxID=2911065 RepID=UPI001F2E5897|nr:CHAP domain-containing protein [Zavarzinia marina]MCF4166424.1 CHAP domain-containing protein [Zavarzinia marina]